jgi:hypothetical protein
MKIAEMKPRFVCLKGLLATGFLLASPSLAHSHGFPEGLATLLLTFIVVLLISQFSLDYLAFKRRIGVDQPFAATIFANFAFLAVLIAGTLGWSAISDPFAGLIDKIPGGISGYSYGAYVRDYDHFFAPVMFAALGITVKTGVLRWLFNVKQTWRVARVFTATSLMSLVFACACGWIAAIFVT